jgi:hypothetical protein
MNPDTLEFLDGYDRWYKSTQPPGGAAETEKLTRAGKQKQVKKLIDVLGEVIKKVEWIKHAKKQHEIFGGDYFKQHYCNEPFPE